MDLILWRHAEVEEGGPGIAAADRNLTARGKKQARHMADWTIKKAGIWWFSNRVRHDESQTILRAVANP